MVRAQVCQPINRSVAQSGSASGLGPEGPRFESLYSDQFCLVRLMVGPRCYIPKTAVRSCHEVPMLCYFNWENTGFVVRRREFKSFTEHQIFALVSLVVEVLFCKQGVVVRFHPGAPNYSWIVKWYNNRLITGHYKFDSCSRNHTWAVRIMGLHWPCKSVIGVRSPNGPPCF